MIYYKKCSQVYVDLIHHAFQVGFSDYTIKIEMPKEVFINRFFGPEGNSLQHSFIALDEDKPIGLVLGGIKNYEGLQTMRCGTLAIDPLYRGTGVSQNLMELHKKEAIKQQCKQLFLEVIVGNDRAINFYKKLGYEKIFDLNYFSIDEINKLKESNKLELNIQQATLDDLYLVRGKIKDIHINWQNDLDYIEKSHDQVIFGAYINDKIAGIISMNKNTKINFIWVQNELRHNGIGSSLILKATENLNLTKASICFPNNASIQGFSIHIGFTKDAVSQYEMFYTFK